MRTLELTSGTARVIGSRNGCVGSTGPTTLTVTPRGVELVTLGGEQGYERFTREGLVDQGVSNQDCGEGYRHGGIRYSRCTRCGVPLLPPGLGVRVGVGEGDPHRDAQDERARLRV